MTLLKERQETVSKGKISREFNRWILFYTTYGLPIWEYTEIKAIQFTGFLFLTQPQLTGGVLEIYSA